MPLRSARRPQSCPRSQRKTLGELEAREGGHSVTNFSMRWAPGMGDTDTCWPSWSSRKRSDDSVNCLILFSFIQPQIFTEHLLCVRPCQVLGRPQCTRWPRALPSQGFQSRADGQTTM